MSLKITYIAIIACLTCSCTSDDILEQGSSATERPTGCDSCNIKNDGIDISGDDFGFDNDNPPTGIVTPTV